MPELDRSSCNMGHPNLWENMCRWSIIVMMGSMQRNNSSSTAAAHAAQHAACSQQARGKQPADSVEKSTMM